MADKACYPDKAPDVDQLLYILKHHVRREIVYFFESFTTSHRSSIDGLVSHMKRRGVSNQSEERLRTSLHHEHLPTLEDAGWVAYNPTAGEVLYYGDDNAEEWIQQIADIF